MSERIQSAARVVVTVEVPVSGVWGDDCKIDQVYRQAAVEARGKIDRAFNGQARILDVNVIAVIAVEKK